MSTNQEHHRNAESGGNSKEKDHVQRIKEQIDWYSRQVLVQRDNILKVDDEIISAQKKLLQGRNNRMFTEDSQEQGKKLEKQIRILERRLNQALMKFNEKIAHNKQIRGKIDERRRERVVYDRIYTNIERELLERTTEMKEIVVDGSKAMKERDKCLNDVEVLKQQVAETLKSLKDDEQELKELLEKHENDQDKEEGGLDNERRQPQEHTAALTALKARSDFKTNEPSADAEPMAQLLDSHSNIEVDTSSGLTNSVDVDAMLASFLEAEEKKFSILNHISELTLEKEQIEKDILQVSREIETLTRSNFKHYNFSPGACQKIKQIEGKSLDFQEKQKVAENDLGSLKAAIKDVYSQLNCENFIPGSNLVLGDAVTDSNVMQYLAIIEQVSSVMLFINRRFNVLVVPECRHFLGLYQLQPAVRC